MGRAKQPTRRSKAKRTDETPEESREDRGAKKAKTAPAQFDDPSDRSLDLLSTLLGGITFDEFVRDYFEKKPLLVRHEGDKKQLYPAGLFSRDVLLDLVPRNKLELGKDMTVCRYVDGERDDFTPSNGKNNISKKQLGGLLDKGYSCQFYQPQRYVDGLFSINSAFEEAFGCLAGASAYLTPPSAQALAPHHDDVEVFILQTQGRKKWKLYKPLVELAGEHSSDLSTEEIGEVWQEFTLEEGDMLYFPRGVVHQAWTEDNVFSTHVTISVYQHNSWANFLEIALPRVIRRAFDSDVAFRRGLPISYLNFVGSQFPHDTPEAKNFAAECKNLVQKLGEWVQPVDLHQAADEAALDYMANRLPPSRESQLSTAEFVLEAQAKVRLRDRSHVRLVLGDDPVLKECIISLFHSSHNCRIHHMGTCSCLRAQEEDSDDESSRTPPESENEVEGDDESDNGADDFVGPAQPQSLVFSGSLAQPLMKLYSVYPLYVTVQELIDVGDNETEVRGMLLRLWSEGLLLA